MYEYFAGIRITGRIEKVNNSMNYIDMMVDKKEAKRIVKFLIGCLIKDFFGKME